MPRTSVALSCRCRVPSGCTCTCRPPSITSSGWYSAGVTDRSCASSPLMSYRPTAARRAESTLPSFKRTNANRLPPTTSSEVVTTGCNVAVGGGESSAAAASADASAYAAATRAARITRMERSLHDHLPVHPRVRRTDVVVDAGLRERDRLRLAIGKHARIPVGAALPGGRAVWQVADVREIQRAALGDAHPGRHEAVLDVVAANPDRVDTGRDRADGSGHRRRRRWRPQRADLAFEGERPHGVAVG